MKIIDSVRILGSFYPILKKFLIYVLIYVPIYCLGVGTLVGLFLWRSPDEIIAGLFILFLALGVLWSSLSFYSWIRLKTDNLLIGAGMLIFFASFLFGLYDVWFDTFSVRPADVTLENETMLMRLSLEIKVLGFVVPAVMLGVAANIITKFVHPEEGNSDRSRAIMLSRRTILKRNRREDRHKTS